MAEQIDPIKSALALTRDALDALRTIPDLKTTNQTEAWGASNFLAQAESLLTQSVPGSARPSDSEWSAARLRVINVAKRYIENHGGSGAIYLELGEVVRELIAIEQRTMDNSHG